MNTILLLVAWTASSTWTLELDQTLNWQTTETVGSIVGPHTHSMPMCSCESPYFTYTNLDQVTQDKGEEDWDIPWATELATLYYDPDLYAFGSGPGYAGSPYQNTLAAGIRHEFRVTFAKSFREQRWSASLGKGHRSRSKKTATLQEIVPCP